MKKIPMRRDKSTTSNTQTDHTWLCCRCHNLKPIEEFRKTRYTNSGYRQPCKACYADERRELARAARQYTIKEVERPKRFDADNPVLHSEVIGLLRPRNRTVKSLADSLGVNEAQTLKVIDSMVSIGYAIEHDDHNHTLCLGNNALPMQPFRRIAPPIFKSSKFTFGLVSDTHMCSIHERLDVLEAAYDEFVHEGVTIVLHAGNIVDGYVPRINGNEVRWVRFADQLAYVLDYYPQRKGVTTHYLSTYCHEGWWLPQGINFGTALEHAAHEAGRTDLVHLGLMEADIPLKGGEVLRVAHPKGGMSYATSYRPQKIVEALQGGEKPRVLILGHFHKMGLFHPRDVWTILAGCCQDQSAFMRGSGIQAEVGYALVTIHQDTHGVICGLDYRPRTFVNKKFYAEKSYKELK